MVFSAISRELPHSFRVLPSGEVLRQEGSAAGARSSMHANACTAATAVLGGMSSAPRVQHRGAARAHATSTPKGFVLDGVRTSVQNDRRFADPLSAHQRLYGAIGAPPTVHFACSRRDRAVTASSTLQCAASLQHLSTRAAPAVAAGAPVSTVPRARSAARDHAPAPAVADSAVDVRMLAATMAARSQLRAAKHALFLDKFGGTAISPALRKALGADAELLKAHLTSSEHPITTTSRAARNSTRSAAPSASAASSSMTPLATDAPKAAPARATRTKPLRHSQIPARAPSAQDLAAAPVASDEPKAMELIGALRTEGYSTSLWPSEYSGTTTNASKGADSATTDDLSEHVCGKTTKTRSAAASRSDRCPPASTVHSTPTLAPTPAASEPAPAIASPKLASEQPRRSHAASKAASRLKGVETAPRLIPMRSPGAAAVGTPSERAAPATERASAVERVRVAPGVGDPLASIGYTTQSPIAAGAFSQVVRARENASGREVAVKTFATRIKGGKPASDMEDVKCELAALTRLQPSSHVHIANLIQTVKTDHELHCVLEYCGGGSVQRHLSSVGHGVGLPEATAMLVAAQVCCALAHVHKHGVTHRDVKPDNVIYTDRTRASCRLVDFGFAKVDEGKRLRTMCGSPAYMAPELVSGKPYMGPPVDVWAVGAMLYEMLHGKVAFRAESMAQLHTSIRRGNHTQFLPHISAKAKAAIKKGLTVDLRERPDAAGLTRHLVDVFDIDGIAGFSD